MTGLLQMIAEGAAARRVFVLSEAELCGSETAVLLVDET
jgi:hypothetical protein